MPVIVFAKRWLDPELDEPCRSCGRCRALFHVDGPTRNEIETCTELCGVCLSKLPGVRRFVA